MSRCLAVRRIGGAAARAEGGAITGAAYDIDGGQRLIAYTSPRRTERLCHAGTRARATASHTERLGDRSPNEETHGSNDVMSTISRALEPLVYVRPVGSTVVLSLGALDFGLETSIVLPGPPAAGPPPRPRP